MNDVVMATCRQEVTVLLSLDISAAFDTVVHSVLLDRALNDFAIDGVALAWLRSFVTGRTQYVGVGVSRSEVVACLSGVPQGSVLGLLLFAMYTSPISNVVSAHGLSHNQYADDTTIYTTLQPGSSTFAAMSDCIDDVAVTSSY